jgi:cytochrome c oxidase subunit 1
MSAPAKVIPYPSPADKENRDGLPQWLLSTDHKRIGILTIGTALFFFLLNGALALTMRAQLAQPNAIDAAEPAIEPSQ